MHRTLACVQSADVGERVRRESGGLQRKVVADLDASNRQLPVTLLPLLGDVSIDKPGALRCASTTDAARLIVSLFFPPHFQNPFFFPPRPPPPGF